MDKNQILFLIALSSFYLTYIVKMYVLKRQGIKGHLLGKGEKPVIAKRLEIVLSIITFGGAMVQYISVLVNYQIWQASGTINLWIAGFVFAVIGIVFFIASVTVMKNNWRAGFNKEQKTELVTDGLYSISRNPAFTGFDLIYIGCALAYPHIFNIVWSVLAVICFHLQILGEEEYLLSVFGTKYQEYRKHVARYIGRYS